MQTFAKTLIGAAAAGVMAVSAAAPASAHDYDGGRHGYHRGVSAHEAVDRCTAAATRTASRYSYGERARVTDIRGVDRDRYGFRVGGRITVNTMGRDWRQQDRAYANRWGRDDRGWNADMRGSDSGWFTCRVDDRGRIADLDFRGIRGL